MDKKTVFVRTEKGENEAQGLTDGLFGDSKRIFNLVDDESTVAELTKRAPPSLRSGLESTLQELVDGGYIRDMNAPEEVEAKPAVKIAAPAFKMATPKGPASAPPSPPPPKPEAPRAPSRAAFEMPEMPTSQAAPAAAPRQESAPSGGKNDLDFSFIMSGSGSAPSKESQESQERSNAEARIKVEAEARAKAEAIAKAAQAKAVAQEAASREAAKKQAYEAAKMKAQIEVAARAKIEAEARAKKEAEAARHKAEQEAMKARLESEAAKAKIEAEVRARIEAEAKVKREAEAIRLKAEQEAERLKRELEEARIKAEIELRNRLEAEARAKAEQEARLKREAEAERLRLEKERAELEAARIKAEAELRMKEEAEARVRAALDARLKSEAEAKVKARIEQEEAQRREAAENTKYHHHPTHSEMDPGDKLRASFAQTSGKDFKKQGYTTGSFKLEAFSLVDTGKMPAARTGEPLKSATPPPLPGGGSKVKAAIEERARKKAEEERLQAEQQIAEKAAQDAIRQQKEQAEANRLKQEQEAAARAKTEAEAQRLKAEHEAYRKKIQEEEEAARAAAESQQLAEQQARQWEEAQQRAQALAIAEQERLAQEATESAKLSMKKARGPRRKLPVGKIAGTLVVLLILAVVALPYIWPMEDYIPSLEAELSSQLKQPVHIARVEAALVPLPKLTLRGVSVGKAEELKAGYAVLNFDITALFVPAKSINELVLEDLVLKGSALGNTALMLQSAGGLEKYPVARMSFRKVRLDVAGMNLPKLNGKAEFNSLGKFVHAQFTTEDDRGGFEMSPKDGNIQLEFNMHEGNLPYFSSLKFNDLSFTANISSRQIILSDFFAHIHGGTLTGKGAVDIVSGWKLQGQINARNIDVQKMLPNSVLSGELGGELNLSMSGTTPALLDKEPHFDGVFEVKNGEIGKIDLETIARFGVRPGVSGHTNFNLFSGTFRSDRASQHLVVNNLSTVNAKTTGVIEVEQGDQLSGKLVVDFKSGLGVADVPARVSGTLAEPVVQAGR